LTLPVWRRPQPLRLLLCGDPRFSLIILPTRLALHVLLREFGFIRGLVDLLHRLRPRLALGAIQGQLHQRLLLTTNQVFQLDEVFGFLGTQSDQQTFSELVRSCKLSVVLRLACAPLALPTLGGLEDRIVVGEFCLSLRCAMCELDDEVVWRTFGRLKLVLLHRVIAPAQFVHRTWTADKETMHQSIDARMTTSACDHRSWVVRRMRIDGASARFRGSERKAHRVRAISTVAPCILPHEPHLMPMLLTLPPSMSIDHDGVIPIDAMLRRTAGRVDSNAPRRAWQERRQRTARGTAMGQDVCAWYGPSSSCFDSTTNATSYSLSGMTTTADGGVAIWMIVGVDSGSECERR
jgi:hypothetical protein